MGSRFGDLVKCHRNSQARAFQIHDAEQWGIHPYSPRTMRMTGDELFDFAASVKDRQDFIKFIENLNADCRERRDEWQNDDLSGFLSGLSGFANDIGGFYKNMGESVDIETVTWRMVAQMLLAATVYGN